MKMFDNINEFFNLVWKRSVILIFLCGLIILFVTKWQVALGVLVGGLILLGDIYLIKILIEIIYHKRSGKKYALIVLSSIIRIIILGVVLLIIIKLNIVNVLGIFIGATIPLISIISLLIFGGISAWKV